VPFGEFESSPSVGSKASKLFHHGDTEAQRETQGSEAPAVSFGKSPPFEDREEWAAYKSHPEFAAQYLGAALEDAGPSGTNFPNRETERLHVHP
jgi:hypothetical protein